MPEQCLYYIRHTCIPPVSLAPSAHRISSRAIPSLPLMRCSVSSIPTIQKFDRSPIPRHSAFSPTNHSPSDHATIPASLVHHVSPSHRPLQQSWIPSAQPEHRAGCTARIHHRHHHRLHQIMSVGAQTASSPSHAQSISNV